MRSWLYSILTFSLLLVSLPLSVGAVDVGTPPGSAPTLPPSVVPASLYSVTLSQSAAIGGTPVTGTVKLTGWAPSGGTVQLSSISNPAVASVPASVQVSGQSPLVSFQVTTLPVAAQTIVTISASYAGVTKKATLTVLPASLSSVTLPPKVYGGYSAHGVVSLTGPATSGGIVVNLQGGIPGIAAVPASVTVAAGATTADFTVTTNKVQITSKVTILAFYGGVTRYASFILAALPSFP